MPEHKFPGFCAGNIFVPHDWQLYKGCPNPTQGRIKLSMLELSCLHSWLDAGILLILLTIISVAGDWEHVQLGRHFTSAILTLLNQLILLTFTV
jgi:hypothetical protein